MVDEKIGFPEQAPLAGYMLKVIEPRGVPKPPERVAVSVADAAVLVKIIVDGDTCVTMVGLDSRTCNVSPLAAQGAR